MTMHFDPDFLIFAIPAVIFAGISKGGFGSGAAFASAPLLVMVVDPITAIGVMLPLLMLIDVCTLKPFWRRWDFEASKLVILGALPGVALGVLFYRIAPVDMFRVLIGAIALAFVVWQLIQKWGIYQVKPKRFGSSVGLGTGVAAGFTSFVSHAGGPPVAVYLLGMGFDKTRYQASSVLIFWAINLFKVVPYTLLGIFTIETLLADLVLAPFALLGVFIGVKAHWRIPEPVFMTITYILLAITGSKLLWDGMF